ncbi:NB-ARC domain-containing protein [Streptomyces sp. T12]|uniref:NB-ARC domain-containing protein n=1 Tax=Streptomyces sp. T12 TaxID=477697 RepID=UPI0023653AA6|nr:NB-ARC domain-containing protein [Streptomyces sp. T12]WDF42463.1 NB-ARC domain-containing protein [Streptomyces sp. T12]
MTGRRVIAVVVLTVTTGVTAALAALAGNAASSQERWPGVLDVLRGHPWPSLLALTFLGVLAAVALFRAQDRPAAGADDPPPPPPAQVPGWVIDRAESDRAVAEVCGTRRGAVGITTALEGAGGFGKTTLAGVVCAAPRVRRRFRGRVYLITLGREVRGRAAIAAKVAEVTEFITGDTRTFTDPQAAGAHLGRLLDQRRRTLLVLDDVWTPEQLAPFLIGGSRCVRLVTTRVPAVLPPGAARIRVDEMSPAQARQVLTWNLPGLPEEVVQGLLGVTGRWALLLRQVNRLIAREVSTGVSAADAGQDLLWRLRQHGPTAPDDPGTALDLDDPQQRAKAVRATVEAATTLLPPGGDQRFAELGVFAEDEAVPVSLAAQLWQATGALTAAEARQLCRTLDDLSLLTLNPADGGTVSLHDIIGDYLRRELGPARLAALHTTLVDTVEAGLPPADPLAPSAPRPGAAWWTLPDGYLSDHLIAHLLAAGRSAHAEAVAGDLRWVETRLHQRGPTAPWSDLDQIPTPTAASRARDLARISHFLTPVEPAHLLTAVLYNRLEPMADWHDQVTARHDQSGQATLTNRWPSPDLADPALQRTLAGHTASVRAVAIAPDGTWLATVGDDGGLFREGEVRIWDRATGTCAKTLTGHTRGVNAVAIAPDGTWLATVGGSSLFGRGGVRIWDRATGTRTAGLHGHIGDVTGVAIAADGTWLATCDDSMPGEVRIWDRATGTRTASLRGHPGGVRGVAIAPDGTWLATVSGTTVRIWDRATSTCTNTLTGHSRLVRAVAIAPDGTWLATGGDDGTVRIWDGVTGTCTDTLTGHTGRVQAVAIAPDGTWLATGGDDGTVRIWDGVTGACTNTLTGHTGTVQAVAIAPDGTWAATGGDDRTVRIWDRPASNATAAAGRAHRVDVVAVAPDGTWLATTGTDGTVRIWDGATGACTDTLTGHTGRVQAVAVAPDGTWLATAGTDKTVRIWLRATGTCTHTLTGHTSEVQAVAIAPDGTWLATGSGETVRPVIYGHTNSGDIPPGGELRITDRATDRGEIVIPGEVRIWDRATGSCTNTLTGHTGSLQAVAIAPDGTWLAAVINSAVWIWDRATGTRTNTLGYNGYVDAMALAPDGTWLATIGHDYDVPREGRVWIWDRATGICTHTLTGHTGEVQAVAIAPDGTRLATTGSDGTVRIWDWAREHPVVQVRTDDSLAACAWTPEGRGLIVGGARGLYFYDFRPGAPTRGN